MNSNSNAFLFFLKIVFSNESIIQEGNLYLIETHKIGFLFQEIFELETKEIEKNDYLNLIEKYKELGIKLIVIYEDQWLNNEAVIKDRINSINGNLIQIHGRKTKAARIDSNTAFQFLNSNHLQGYINSKIKYGLFLVNELVAVATFAAGRKMRDKPESYRSFELIQFANKGGFNVVGGLSKLLNTFIENHKPGNIMTYIDRAWSEGEAFKQMGFVQTGFLNPQQFFVENEDFVRYTKREVDEFRDNFIPVWNAGSIKLVLEIEK